jgi:hypothetical protein
MQLRKSSNARTPALSAVRRCDPGIQRTTQAQWIEFDPRSYLADTFCISAASRAGLSDSRFALLVEALLPLARQLLVQARTGLLVFELSLEAGVQRTNQQQTQEMLPLRGNRTEEHNLNRGQLVLVSSTLALFEWDLAPTDNKSGNLRSNLACHQLLPTLKGWFLQHRALAPLLLLGRLLLRLPFLLEITCRMLET